MNLIHNIERHDKTKQKTEVQQIKTELNRSGNQKLRYKIDLIEKYLSKVNIMTYKAFKIWFYTLFLFPMYLF